MIIGIGDQHSEKWGQGKSRDPNSLKAVKIRVLKIMHSTEQGAKGGL